MSNIPYFDKAKAVEVELDKPRLLYFNIGSASDLERKMGASILSLFQSEQSGLSTMTSVGFLRSAYQIGLQSDEPGITQQRVDGILEEILSSCETPKDHSQALMGLGMMVLNALRNCGAFPKAPKEEKKENSEEETSEEPKLVGKPKKK